MRSAKLLALCISALLAGCGPGGPAASKCSSSNFTSSRSPNVGSAGANANVMSITVNGALCGNPSSQYANEPCASVTICSPAQPSNCQTINNILLDTGSYGLRIFSSVLTVPLTPLTNGTQALAECVQFGDGSSEWGPVKTAYVKLGNEPAVSMSIHVVDAGYGTAPGPCSSSQSTPDTGPAQAGFNGILGVGPLAQDCGADCVTDLKNGQYFSCSGSDCSCGATVPLASQVQNPIPLLPTDNNGLLLSLPAVGSSSGTASLSGNLYLGIGTQSNNTPSGVKTFFADQSGNISTVFAAYSSQAIASFIDSGSSMLFLPPPTSGSLPDCKTANGADWAGLFCPSSPQTLTAVNYSTNGNTNGSVSFQVGNAYSLLNSSMMVFNDLGGSVSDLSGTGGSEYFDWGLPFFYGRNVYIGIEGTHSALGSGQLWAY